MNNPINNRRGSSYFTPVVVILIIAMILSVVFFYATTKSTIETTRDNTKRVLDSYVMKNSIEIYNSIKQGSDFTEAIKKSFYISSVSEELSLDFGEGYLYTVDENGGIVYRMTNPDVTYKDVATIRSFVGNAYKKLVHVVLKRKIDYEILHTSRRLVNTVEPYGQRTMRFHNENKII